jgi:ADP-dependent NAD(P)H-hydrate dehydratase / NAD(P)H-hydrate epimerase
LIGDSFGASILTAAEMRAAEDAAIAAGTDVLALMERAGSAVADAVWRFGGGRATLILCGPGNNGGDGYVAARLLQARGIDVRVAALGEPKTAAAINARAGWAGSIETLKRAKTAPILVDALFGTGLTRALDGDVAAALKSLSAAAHFVVAVDVPSGVSTDDGANLGAVACDFTLALGRFKPAHVLQPAASLAGVLRVADIGIATESMTRLIKQPVLAPPLAKMHKYSRGMAAIIGGEMPGAAVLAASAAAPLAGYIVLTGRIDGGPHAIVRRAWIDVARDDHVGAILIGPGLGRSNEARTILGSALSTVHGLVIDGDALTLLAETGPPDFRRRTEPVILTPHEGEFSRMFGVGAGSKIDRARAAAAASGTTIILKGADTVIAAADGRVIVANELPSWLASAGTGDVLAGLVVALLAGGMAPIAAAETAVWIHREAGRLAAPALIADDLCRLIPTVVARCL